MSAKECTMSPLLFAEYVTSNSAKWFFKWWITSFKEIVSTTMFFPDLFLKSVLPGKDSASLYLNSSKVDKTPSSEEKKF